VHVGRPLPLPAAAGPQRTGPPAVIVASHGVVVLWCTFHLYVRLAYFIFEYLAHVGLRIVHGPDSNHSYSSHISRSPGHDEIELPDLHCVAH
jgi:hypothetical protein